MPRPLLTLVPLLAAAVILACGGDDKPSGDGSGAALSPAEIVRKGAAAVKDLKAFHFKLDHKNGGTPIPLGLELTTAEGDVSVPGKLAADVRAKAAGAVTVSVKVIGIDDKTWLTNPFTRRWQLLPGASVSDIADPAGLVQAALASLSEVKADGEAEVDGVKTYKVTGKIDAASLKQALSTVQSGYTANVEMWIGKDDFLPRRLKLIGQLSADEPKDIEREISLSRFGQAVEIKPPE